MNIKFLLIPFLILLMSCLPSKKDGKFEKIKGSWKITHVEYGQVHAIDVETANSAIGKVITITSDCITFPNLLAEKCCFTKYNISDNKNDVELIVECSKKNYKEKVILVGDNQLDYQIDGVRFISKRQ